jgi:hypothetical protein
MNMLKEYFNVIIKMRGGGGIPNIPKMQIPEITLAGSLNDWQMLAVKSLQLVNVKCLPEFSARWAPALGSVLNRIVEQYTNAAVDTNFWESFCAHKAGYITGWINVFFPDIKSPPGRGGEPLCPLVFPQEYENTIIKTNRVPDGICAAPVTWVDTKDTFMLDFWAGFVGAAQVNDGVITPSVGWMVCRPKPEGATGQGGASKSSMLRGGGMRGSTPMPRMPPPRMRGSTPMKGPSKSRMRGGSGR